MSRPKIKRRAFVNDVSALSQSKAGTLIVDDLGMKHVAESLGKCPFCGAGDVMIIGKEATRSGVGHSNTPCPKFLAEEPGMFVHNMRIALVGRMPDDDDYPMPIKQDPS